MDKVSREDIRGALYRFVENPDAEKMADLVEGMMDSNAVIALVKSIAKNTTATASDIVMIIFIVAYSHRIRDERVERVDNNAQKAITILTLAVVAQVIVIAVLLFAQ